MDSAFVIVCADKSHVFDKVEVMKRLGLFMRKPSLLEDRGYFIKSFVDSEAFDMFVQFFQKGSVGVTYDNASQLMQLARELEYQALIEACAPFCSEVLVPERDFGSTKLKERVCALEEQAHDYAVELQALEDEFAVTREDVEGHTVNLDCIWKLFDKQKNMIAALTKENEENREKIAALETKVAQLKALVEPIVAGHQEDPKATETVHRKLVDLLKEYIQRRLARRTVVGSKAMEEIPEQPEKGIPLVDTSDPWNGIIAYLTNQCDGRNPLDEKVFAIIASSPGTGVRGSRNICDFESLNYYCSDDAMNQWIGYDFMAHEVIVTNYAIRSRSDHYGLNLKSWVFEGTTDQNVWYPMDTQNNVSDLCQKNVVKIFTVQNQRPCSCVRIRQTGKNNVGKNNLVITSLEVFGYLK